MTNIERDDRAANGKFIKGHKKLPGAGWDNRKGQGSYKTRYLKDALMITGHAAGGRLVSREVKAIIENTKQRILNEAKKEGKEIDEAVVAKQAAEAKREIGELEECVAEHGPLVGYLTWLALEHPATFGPMLVRVLPLQVKMTEEHTHEHRSIEEIQADLDAISIPLSRLAPLLIAQQNNEDEIDKVVEGEVIEGDKPESEKDQE